MPQAPSALTGVALDDLTLAIVHASLFHVQLSSLQHSRPQEQLHVDIDSFNQSAIISKATAMSFQDTVITISSTALRVLVYTFLRWIPGHVSSRIYALSHILTRLSSKFPR